MFHVFLKKDKCRGNVPPSVSSESRVEMSQQKDLVLFFLYVFVEWLIKDESSRSWGQGPDLCRWGPATEVQNGLKIIIQLRVMFLILTTSLPSCSLMLVEKFEENIHIF